MNHLTFPTDDMDFTMLMQWSRQAHVDSSLENDSDLKPLQEIFMKTPSSVDIQTLLSDAEEAEFLMKGTELSVEQYQALGEYLASTERQYSSIHSRQDRLSATQHTRFLPPTVRVRTEVDLDGRTFSTRTSHEGNSAVQFTNPTSQRLETGNIEMIWQLPLEHRIHTFFVIRPHKLLSPAEENLAPFAQFNEIYGARIVDSDISNQLLIVEQQHIRTHLSTYRRPAGTYGIPRQTLVVCWALNRGRR